MGIMDKVGEFGGDMKEKIQQLAREHNLDPDRVDEWPEEIKQKIM